MSLAVFSRASAGSALRREIAAAERIPYTAQVGDTVVRTVHGDYVQVFQLAGASFESADDEAVNGWHERLNVLWRNIASPQVALWSHVIRRRELAGGEAMFRQRTFSRSCQPFSVSSSALSKLAPASLKTCT